MRSNRLEFLDISGQPIDERTIIGIVALGSSLKEFYFDGVTELSNGEALDTACRTRFLGVPAGRSWACALAFPAGRERDVDNIALERFMRHSVDILTAQSAAGGRSRSGD
jgi:hypothetical protein